MVGGCKTSGFTICKYFIPYANIIDKIMQVINRQVLPFDWDNELRSDLSETENAIQIII
jgi:hypothetical protein